MNTFATAVKDSLQTAGIVRAYAVGEVPPTPSLPYLVYGVSRDEPFGRTLDGNAGPAMVRVTTQSFGRTLASALDLDERAYGALDGTPALTVPGWDVSPGRLQVGGAVVRDPDGGGVDGITSTYLIPATKETP